MNSVIQQLYSGHWSFYFPFYLEMEFLDINWRKDSSLLLHAIHSLFTVVDFKRKSDSGFKNTCKNIRETRKLESLRE
jgi:hypothetical protein